MFGVLPCRHGIRRLSSYTKEEIAARIQTYFKFMFVRHPVTRLVSAFKNKFVDEHEYLFQKYMPKILHYSRRKVLEPKQKNHIQFTDFISYLFTADTPLRHEEHFVGFDELCSPCTIKYDFIGKQETYNQDSNFLLQTFFKRKLILFKSLHATHSDKETTHDMFVNVSKKHQDIIKKEYADDSKMFEYTLNGYI